MGRLQGSLKSFSGTDLGGFAIKAALERSGVSPDEVDYVIMGQVLQAGAGQITARQAAVKGGISMDVPALTINKVCLSGIDAIALADQLIRAGEFDVVVAGGMESMTNAPHLLTGSRDGVKYGDWTMVDSMAFDALTCAFDECAMGESTERHNGRFGLTREEQDAFSAQSHQRAAAAAAHSPRRSRRSRFPSARGTRSSSPATRACGRTRPRNRWADCGRPSPRTGRSPRAMPRRSRTAPRPWSS